MHSRSLPLWNAFLFGVTIVVLFPYHERSQRTGEYEYMYSNLCAGHVGSQAAQAETINHLHYCKSST